MNYTALLIEKFSKKMIKRNKGTTLPVTLKSKEKIKLVRTYTGVKAIYSSTLMQNMNAFISGRMSRSDFLDNQKIAIKKAFSSAYSLGKEFGTGTPGILDDNEKRFITQQTTSEMAYMTAFADDIANGSGSMPYARRMRMYSDGLDSMFGFGRLVYIPDDAQIIWALGATDKHCMDCLVFASRSPYTKKDLPGFPKSGASRCLSNCMCSLRYVFKSSITSSNYDSFIMNSKNTSSSKNIPSEEEYKHLMDLREQYYYNKFMFEISKDQKFKTTADNVMSEFNTYKKANNLYFPVFFNMKQNMIDLKAFNKNMNFSLLSSGTTPKVGQMLSVFMGETQTYMVVESVNNGIIAKTLEGLLYQIDPTRNVIFLEK